MTQRPRPATHNEPAIIARERISVHPFVITAILHQSRPDWNVRPGASINEERTKKRMHSNAEDWSTYYVPGTHKHTKQNNTQKKIRCTAIHSLFTFKPFQGSCLCLFLALSTQDDYSPIRLLTNSVQVSKDLFVPNYQIQLLITEFSCISIFKTSIFSFLFFIAFSLMTARG